jgi:transposase-like protein
MQGASTRIGTYKCRACRKPFTVKIGTIFEGSHVKMTLWLQAIYLMCASKKGCSSNQLHRTLGVTLKTAWFMSHRIREAMRNDDLAGFGSDGGIVEVDETYIGVDRDIKPKGEKKGRGFHHKYKVLSLVDRNTGRAKSMVVDQVNAKTLIPLVNANIQREARVFTDEAAAYKSMYKHHEHKFVRHGAGEWANGEVHTNTIEGYFSIFKRGMKGVYQHCGKKHLHRYLAEYDFRYNHREKNGYNDTERMDSVMGVLVPQQAV